MGDAADLRVEQVSLPVTADLRNRVLGPGRTPDPASRVSLQVAGTATFAVLVGDDPGEGAPASEPIATVTVMPEMCPWRPGATVPWRLRGMATDDGWRGLGIGRWALDTAVAHAAGQGATVLWCNARVAASTFYERGGFVVEGDRFEVDGIGLHLPMARTITLR